MRDRYPTTSGFRLDEPGSLAEDGPVIDGVVGRGGKLRLYVCESVGHSVALNLTSDEIIALRDGLNRALVHIGECEIVSVPIARRG